MNVLVAEDSLPIRMLITKIINKIGGNIIEATNGAEAIECIKTHDIDLVIMDAEMPKMDGFEATSIIRTLKAANWIPIIFLSGHTEDEYIEKALNSGADVYLRKPINRVELRGQVQAMRRISEMKANLDELNRQLIVQANEDALTKLANRRKLNERMEYDLLHADRNNMALTVAMCDIDNFKTYNDTYGHQAGDECLAKVAQALKSSFRRAIDFIARYGGEEFVVLMPNTTAENATLVVKRMLENVRALKIEHRAARPHGIVTLSVGISTTKLDQFIDQDKLLKQADDALYQAKEQGKNRVVLYQG